MNQIAQDVRYAVRSLLKSPGFTLVAVITLALGIGANTAIFELLNAVVLRPLPVSQPDQLAEVRIVVRKPRTGNFDGRRPEMTYPQWQLVRQRQEPFAKLGAWFTARMNMASSGEDRFVNNALWVSGEFFEVFGVRPLLGRTLGPSDDQPGCSSPGVVISYPFWQREFGGRADAIGKRITLNGYPFEVIGVTPQSFFGVEVGRYYDTAIPICADPLVNPETRRMERRDSWWLAAIGRLKPDWTVERASSHLQTISAAIYQETMHAGYNPQDVKDYSQLRLGAVPAGNGVTGLRNAYANSMWLILAGTGFVLLIACANLANLMLARASARERELAVRLAIGASRRRLLQQLLTESLLVAGAGALAGALLARVLSQAIVVLHSVEGSPRYLEFGADWRVLSFIAGLAVLTCILFGLAPAIRATRTAPAAAMNAGARGMTASPQRFHMRRVLVISQIALSLVLLTGALLFGRTLQNLMTLDAGFRQDGILQVDMQLRVPQEQRDALNDELLRRVRSVAGVSSAAFSSYVPLGGSSWNDNVIAQVGGQERRAVVNFDRVSPGFFQTLEIPIIAGRDFNERDTGGGPRVAIVNQSFAKKFFDGGDPLGKTFQIEGDAGTRTTYEIIGLARDTKYDDLRAEFGPIAYMPVAQQPAFNSRFSTMVVRSGVSMENLVPAVKRAIEETSSGVTFSTSVFRTQIRDSLVQERLLAALTGFFGVLAAALASIGLYGVMSYLVARRTHEIGVRMALGATRAQVMKLVLRESSLMLIAGVLFGVAMALWVGKATSALLYGLKPTDPATLLMGAGLLAAVALVASYIPARRAMKVDPMVALRYE